MWKTEFFICWCVVMIPVVILMTTGIIASSVGYRQGVDSRGACHTTTKALEDHGNTLRTYMWCDTHLGK